MNPFKANQNSNNLFYFAISFKYDRVKKKNTATIKNNFRDMLMGKKIVQLRKNSL